LQLTSRYGKPGLKIFVYGRNEEDPSAPSPRRFAARQTLQASERVAMQHKLPQSRQLFIQQNPTAIDAGVFHNDVIAFSNENVMIYHEQAYVDQRISIMKIKALLDFEIMIEVSASEMTLHEAVSTFFFNSQLVTLPHDPQTGT